MRAAPATDRDELIFHDRIDAAGVALLAFATSGGLLRLAFLETEDEDAVMHEVATRVSPRMEHAPSALGAFRRQLEDHLAGRRADVDVPVDLRLASPYGRRVLDVLRRIPVGHTTTYRQIAETLGTPGASRAVGTACARNPVPFAVPCHRVLRSGGGLGGYRGGTALKRRLLLLEGAQLIGAGDSPAREVPGASAAASAPGAAAG